MSTAITSASMPASRRRRTAPFWAQRTHYDGAVVPRETTFNMPTEAGRHQVAALQGYDLARIADYHAGGCKALLYKETIWTDVSSGLLATDQFSSVGISYADALAGGWMLLTGASAQIQNTGNANYHLMDPGNAAMQNKWAANVIAQCARDGWGGVFADDLSLRLFLASATPASYPNSTDPLLNPTDWQAAVQSFLDNAVAQVRAAGYLVVINTSAQVNFPSVAATWMTKADGMMEEGFMRTAVDKDQAYSDIANTKWQKQVDNAIAAEAANCIYVCEIPARNTDAPAVRYGLATALLARNAKVLVDVLGTTSFAAEYWLEPDFSDVLRLGDPLGSYTPNGEVITNMITNPSLESATTTGWATTTPFTVGTGTLALTTTAPASGTNALLYTPPSAVVNEGVGITVAGPPETSNQWQSGTTYRLVIYDRALNVPAGAGRTFDYHFGTATDSATVALATSSTGRFTELAWTPAVTVNSAWVVFRYTGVTSQPVILDAVMAGKLPAAQAYVDPSTSALWAWNGTAHLSTSHGPIQGWFERAFQNGWVFVNPFAAAPSVPIDLSANGPYTGSGYSSITSLSLPALTGVVLVKTT